jgi:hypothetical protein
MNSKILGTCSLDLPDAEVAAILNFAGDNRDYSEFHYGDWKTFVFWNQSGSDEDGVVDNKGKAASLTPRGRALPSLNKWITETFDISRLKLARVHSLGDGVLIPHRDFVEFGEEKRPWTRVHVPLVTNDRCLHSEEATVFRMRAGEVWFLDASNRHSATNLSDQRRLNLCLDFELGDLPLRAIFNDVPRRSAHVPAPDLVERVPLEDGFSANLLNRAQSLNHRNFRDMLGWLAKVHFTHSVHIAKFFDWMIAAAQASGDPSLLDKAIRYSNFLQHQRQMGERFVL